MKFKSLLFLFSAVALCCIQTSCQRTAGDVWEDTKTAGRQMGRGLRTMAGNRAYNGAPSGLQGPCDNEFVPLADKDIVHRLASSGGYDLPNSEPGVNGAPSIDSYSSPSTAEQKKIFANIHFDTDDYTIRGENKQIATNVANYLQRNPNCRIFVEGHCDERGPAAYNLALGAKRASAVRNQLITNGANPEVIQTVSYGKERPCAQGSDPDALQQNRRAEFKIYFSR